MIPFIRSHSELMAITKSRDTKLSSLTNNDIHSSIFDSGQRKRYLNSLTKKEVDLPDLPKTIRRKWIDNKDVITKFFDNLDYNNQIPSSYDLTLLARQGRINQKDAA